LQSVSPLLHVPLPQNVQVLLTQTRPPVQGQSAGQLPQFSPLLHAPLPHCVHTPSLHTLPCLHRQSLGHVEQFSFDPQQPSPQRSQRRAARCDGAVPDAASVQSSASPRWQADATVITSPNKAFRANAIVPPSRASRRAANCEPALAARHIRPRALHCQCASCCVKSLTISRALAGRSGSVASAARRRR